MNRDDNEDKQYPLNQEELEQFMDVLTSTCKRMGWSLAMGVDTEQRPVGFLLGEYEYVAMIQKSVEMVQNSMTEEESSTAYKASTGMLN